VSSTLSPIFGTSPPLTGSILQPTDTMKSHRLLHRLAAWLRAHRPLHWVDDQLTIDYSGWQPE
jgi:hypothetical protein